MRFYPVLALASFLLAGNLKAADCTIKFTITGGGQSHSEVRYYASEFMMVRNETDQQDALTDFKHSTNYLIDHKRHLITRFTFKEAKAALAALKRPRGGRPTADALLGESSDCKVVKGGAETVAGHACQSWSIRVGKLTQVVVADPALKSPIAASDLANLREAQATELVKQGPMGANFKRLFEEMSKIQGIPLKTSLSGIEGFDSTAVATSVSVGAIPAATFTLPAQYRVEDLGRPAKAAGKKK